MSTRKKNTRRDAADKELEQAWGLTLNAARDIRNRQIESGAPSISDVMPQLLHHFDAELRDFGSLCLGVVPDPGPDGPRWLSETPGEGSGPIFAGTTNEAGTVAISGGSNSGKTTMLHVLIEQAAAVTSPRDTAIIVAGAEPLLISRRLEHLGDRIAGIVPASPAGLTSSCDLRNQNLVFIDDLDRALDESPDLWNYVVELDCRPDVRIFFTAAAAVPRTVPRQLLTRAVRVSLQGGTLPSAHRPTAPWMFTVSPRTSMEGPVQGLCFTDLPAGNSPTDPDSEYLAPHREALGLVRRGKPGAGMLRQWSILNSSFTLKDLDFTELRPAQVPIAIGATENGIETTTWSIDFDDARHLVIAGARRSGRTSALETLVLASAIRPGGSDTAYMLIDGSGGDLGAVADSPNVAAYARVTDPDDVDRIIAAADLAIKARREDPAFKPNIPVEQFLAGKGSSPEDQYSRLVLMIDGIGGFLGEERADQAKRLRSIIDLGASVGVHLVYTADTAASAGGGNTAHYSIEVPSAIQLPSTDYSGAKMPPEVRITLSDRIPLGVPGRSVCTDTWLPARLALPVPADDPEAGVSTQVRELVGALNGTDGAQKVPALHYVPNSLDWAASWSALDRWPAADKQHQVILGAEVATAQVAALPAPRKDLLIYGQGGAGKTSTARAAIEYVTHAYTPSEAVVILIDPRRDLLGERDRLLEGGYLRPAKAVPSRRSGEMYPRPHGYSSTTDEIREQVEMLIKLMRSRRPDNHATVDDLRNRTYFTGPEVFVIVDNFHALTQGFMAKSVFDEVGVGDESVSSLLAQGVDLGVHFIVTDNTGFVDRVKSSQFLRALRDDRVAPILQLSAPPSTGSPISGAYHLRSVHRVPGRGRLIIDAEDHPLVQVGWAPPTESVAATSE